MFMNGYYMISYQIRHSPLCHLQKYPLQHSLHPVPIHLSLLTILLCPHIMDLLNLPFHHQRREGSVLLIALTAPKKLPTRGKTIQSPAWTLIQTQTTTITTMMQSWKMKECFHIFIDCHTLEQYVYFLNCCKNFVDTILGPVTSKSHIITNCFSFGSNLIFAIS